MTTPTKEIRTLTGAVELRQGEGDGSTVYGYAAKYSTLSEDLGGFRETIAPGAFTRTLSTNQDILCYYNHDSNAILGRTKSGTLSVREDSTGLYFEVSLPDTGVGRDVKTLIARGDLAGCSFGFLIREQAWERRDGETPIRELRDVELLEVSLCGCPAYPDTALALRSFEEWAAEMERDETHPSTRERDAVRLRLRLEEESY